MSPLEIFFASLFLVGGALLIVAGVVSFRKSRASTAWPTVEGSIVASGVETSDEHYYPRVHYLYSFGGESFRGSSIRFVERGYNFKRSAKAAASRYKVGQPVVVSVNPAAPGEAVLQPGPQLLASAFVVTVGVVFFGVAVLSFLDLIRITN
jgi:hypothetical protein